MTRCPLPTDPPVGSQLLPRGEIERAVTAFARSSNGGLIVTANTGAIWFNEHLDDQEGPLVFHHACKLGLEGIVLKRRDSPYSSSRSRHWIKSKNRNAPVVKREAEEGRADEKGERVEAPLVAGIPRGREAELKRHGQAGLSAPKLKPPALPGDTFYYAKAMAR